MTAITQSDVTQALNSMREAMNTLARAIEAQSTQVRELAEENQRLHDTVKNRDETIAWMRDRAEQSKAALIATGERIDGLVHDNDTFAAKITQQEKELDTLLRANLEASDEIKGLRQLILEVTLTTAKAAEVGAKPKADPHSNVTPLPRDHINQHVGNPDPASTFGG